MTSWTKGEITVVASAVRRAPSVHNTQPWILEFHDGSISLFERLDISLPWHDPTGRDRLISCGAALANLVLATRILGWDVEPLLFPKRDRPDEVARVVATGRRAPSDLDWATYSAIPWRRSHRGPFLPKPVPDSLRHALVDAANAGGVQLRPVRGPAESAVLAEVLTHTGLVLRNDRAYQRELALWTNERPDHRPGGGIPALAHGVATLPWAGLVRPNTTVPDRNVLAARLDQEYLMLVETPDDGHRDHLLAGRAIQDTWLAASRDGLAGSVLTQPLHLSEVRAGLIERLGLAGFPQALLRFGYAGEAGPHSPRVPLTDLIRWSDKEEGTP
jgi:nitroreductase